jgi:hypothetical protein
LRRGLALAVDVFSFSDSDRQDFQSVILNLADDPEIAHSVSPKFSETGTLHRFPDGARIVECWTVLKKGEQVVDSKNGAQ